MRAPPESLIPITGQPTRAARSISLQIFSPMTSPSEPPKTVKSWLKTHTRRPSIVPWPVITASASGRLAAMPKSLARGEAALRVLLLDRGSLGMGGLAAQLAELRELLRVAVQGVLSHADDPI